MTLLPPLRQRLTIFAKEELVAQYGHLLQIEKTFRISKSDLQVRPIHHRLK